MRRTIKMFQRSSVRLFVLAAAGFFIFMTNSHITKTSAVVEPVTDTTAAVFGAATNPLTARWTGPYGGIPPFEKVKVGDIGPALDIAMKENLAEIDAITANKAAPTFTNTFIPLEKSGDMLNRVQTIFGIYSSNLASP